MLAAMPPGEEPTAAVPPNDTAQQPEINMLLGGVNPWGCRARSDNPHGSTIDPGPGWIQAKSHILCASEPPSYSSERISQELWRQESGVWKVRRTKVSQCTFGVPGIGIPVCKHSNTGNKPMMTAFINWKCTPGSIYNYKVVGDFAMTVGDKTYRKHNDRTANNVLCEYP